MCFIQIRFLSLPFYTETLQAFYIYKKALRTSVVLQFPQQHVGLSTSMELEINTLSIFSLCTSMFSLIKNPLNDRGEKVSNGRSDQSLSGGDSAKGLGTPSIVSGGT
jgi:hypothetical protein